MKTYRFSELSEKSKKHAYSLYLKANNGNDEILTFQQFDSNRNFLGIIYRSNGNEA